ncbi:MAG: SapC family protein [Desulfobulbaceae bacterium]|nr:SapC family protein [Desulfobulbaceae bacterium]
MSNYIALSKTQHASSGWKGSSNYRFAAQTAMVSLLADEIKYIIPSLPVAFRERQDQAGRHSYELVALLAPFMGINLFVKPDGQWQSGYVPALFRAYPFRLFTAADTGQHIICFDQESGLLTTGNEAESRPFFDEKGALSPYFARVMEFMEVCERSRVSTQAAVDCLSELGLIVPWAMGIKNPPGKMRPLAGVFKINAAALQELTAESLAKLHQCGALAIAYAQLLSEPRLQQFGDLLRPKVPAPQKKAKKVTPVDIEALFGSKSDLLNFDNL